ncbi:GmrSD restriction endonuclease domain-containing protein [Kineococcus sp. SYSU DK005]|uniref:GmrSD restriction endonuclease domain-containing protein n=1 Tax=Kineococcus sp. SYSU DK005 TaxID=3383126 RepID=UPI003D7E057B
MTTWPSPRRRVSAAAAAGAVAAVLLAGCTPGTSTTAASSSPAGASGTSSPASPPPGAPVPAATSVPAEPPASAAPAPAAGAPAGGAQAQSALAILETLEVKGRAPKTGYSRDQFGDGWIDTDHNGCDSRNDVLARDLIDESFKPGTRDCVVATGTLADPYSGTTITFVRGQDTSSAVQIDHVVALSDAWQKGAQQWEVAKRVAFANDGLELLAVDGPLNGQKGDGDAATWLPPNRAYRCTYVARQVALKATWGLWVTAAERDAIAGVLASCPDQPVPISPAAAPASGGGSAAPAPAPAAPAPAPAPAAPAPADPPPADPAPADPEPAAGAGTDPDFGTCKAANAAGYGPYVQGQDPEYGFYRDADGDGTVCE